MSRRVSAIILALGFAASPAFAAEPLYHTDFEAIDVGSEPEGFMIIITTQSDEPPTGAFKTELDYARAVRDGDRVGGVLLPVLYEFPDDIAKDQARWGDTAVWPMVMPNLGRSQRIESLVRKRNDAVHVIRANPHPYETISDFTHPYSNY